VILTSTSGGRFVYRVTDQFIVSPSQYDVLAASETPILTLTSCHPRYSAKQRIIVQAALDPSRSAPLDVAPPSTTPPTVPPTDAGPPATLPGDKGATTVAPTTAASAVAPATSAPGTDPPPVIGGPELQRGWFDDPDAWPQVALWGLALIGVSWVAWMISRRTRHNWIGAAAGVVPFLFCLYFFFENVNRLLPPNI